MTFLSSSLSSSLQALVAIENRLKEPNLGFKKKKNIDKTVQLLVKILHKQEEQIVKELRADLRQCTVMRSIGGKLRKLDPVIFKKPQSKLNNQSIQQCLGYIQHAARASKSELSLSRDLKGESPFDEGFSQPEKITSTLDSKEFTLGKILENEHISSWKDLNKIIKIDGINPQIVALLKKTLKEHPDFLNELAHPYFDNKNIMLYKSLITAGCPITIEMFNKCLLFQNLPLISFMLRQVDVSWIQKHSKSILNILFKTLDANSAEMIFKSFPDLGAECPIDLLKKAVDEGRTPFVKWMLGHGMKIDPGKLHDYVGQAIKDHDLALTNYLCKYAQKQKKQPSSFYTLFSYPEILGLDKLDLQGTENRDKRYWILFAFALNSPLSEVYELVRTYKEFQDVLLEVLSKIALLVRLPKYYRTEVSNEFENNKNYISLSEKYASENLGFVQNILPKLTTLSREELLDEIVKDRLARGIPLDTDYSKKTVEEDINPTTPILPLQDHGYPTYKRSLEPIRYYSSLTQLMKCFYSASRESYLMKKRQSVHITPNGLEFIYPLAPGDSSKDVPLTQFFDLISDSVFTISFLNWKHTLSKNIKRLKARVDNLHRELLDYKLNINDPENAEAFYKKVAEAYWLIATLCERLRGTPHNAMLYLNIIYAYHGLPPPIPKLDYYYLDNSMLMNPVEVVKKNWRKYFEPIPKFVAYYKKEKVDEKQRNY